MLSTERIIGKTLKKIFVSVSLVIAEVMDLKEKNYASKVPICMEILQTQP
jgi:hypothetical protein